MKTEISSVAAKRPSRKITLLMMLCGVAGAMAVGAANADSSVDAAPQVAIKYDPQALDSDQGAKAVYRHLMRAAESVCPDVPSSSRIVSNAILQCREEAVARAVHQINNPRLAAMSESVHQSG